MKKMLFFVLILALVLALTGYLLKAEQVREQSNSAIVSEDDSLEVIEQELEQTNLQEFDTELDSLDEEINQL
ncbi:hypothetical protein ACFL18_01235 [Patescibacteria group bacterium]